MKFTHFPSHKRSELPLRRIAEAQLFPGTQLLDSIILTHRQLQLEADDRRRRGDWCADGGGSIIVRSVYRVCLCGARDKHKTFINHTI